MSPILIGRFKEREENVKADIFHAYIALLKQTKPAICGSGMIENRYASNGFQRQDSIGLGLGLRKDANMMDLDYESGPGGMLMSQVCYYVLFLSANMKFWVSINLWSPEFNVKNKGQYTYWILILGPTYS